MLSRVVQSAPREMLSVWKQKHVLSHAANAHDDGDDDEHNDVRAVGVLACVARVAVSKVYAYKRWRCVSVWCVLNRRLAEAWYLRLYMHHVHIFARSFGLPEKVNKFEVILSQ